MKKLAKIVTVLLIATLSIVALAACTPSDPFDYLDKVLEKQEAEIEQSTGENQSTHVIVKGGEFCMETYLYNAETDRKELANAIYLIKDGDKFIAYSMYGDQWMKTEVTAEEVKEELDGMFEGFKNYKKEDFKQDGKTYKNEADGTVLSVEGGKLIIKNETLKMSGSVSLKVGKITLPAAAKDAVDAGAM